MIIDLTHNKIIADTITDAFKEGFMQNLLPKLKEKLKEDIICVQMYEDYIADNFLFDGEWYYPLTVVTNEGCLTEWIKWKVNKSDFKDSVPYSYVGNAPLSFDLSENAPVQFADKLSNRARFFETGLIKINVETTAKDITFLSGKYSQTFIDEMTRQLTPAIESAMSIEKLSGSVIELSLVFAPHSYMEHTSENVTYRRLLLTDKSSAPRDFWIKWTRNDGATAYSVSDHARGDSVTFEIGEDVSQKVREKEYRFLITQGKDKYHNAMGRKNITEWREIIKRAIRKGYLVKMEKNTELSDSEAKFNAQIASMLGKSEQEISKAQNEPEIALSVQDQDDFERAMQIARETVFGKKEEYSDDEAENEEIEEEESDELDEYYSESDEAESDEGIKPQNEGEEAELDEITKMALGALNAIRSQGASEVTFEEEPAEQEESARQLFSDEKNEESKEPIIIVPDDPTEEERGDWELAEIEDEEALEEDEEILRDVRALEPDGDEFDENTEPSVDSDRIAANRKEIEEEIRKELEAKLRLEYEIEARRRAEEEAERLRLEQQKLRFEYEKLQLAQKKEEEERARREQERLAEADRLRAQIEAQLRAEARERERLADAARAAVEQQRMLEEEKLRIEQMRIEEERRREAERLREREEELRLAEAERIRKEAEERAKGESENRTLDIEINPNYTYTSKHVRLLFRRSVDPNITARIHEIIKATIEYYGKEKVYLKIKATVPDSETVILEFVKIPMEEMELLSNIIKVLGNSGLGIAKAIVE